MSPAAAALRFPSIEALRAFEAAARLGSYERAADELGVTASAIGKRIATLEDLLGTAVLGRSGRGLALTVTGKEYLAQVQAALGLLAAVPLHHRGRQRAQKLRVAMPPTFAREIVVPALPDYVRAHPQVELEVVLSVPFLDTGAVEADVEVRHGAPAAVAQSWGGRPLMRDVVLPMSAPALLARHGKPRRPGDLARWPLLASPVEPWAPWQVAMGLPVAEPVQGPRLVDLGLMLEAAAAGMGVALARPSLARQWLRTGRLRPLSPSPAWRAEPDGHYHLLLHGRSDAAQRFAAWLAQACGAAAADGLDALSAQT